MTGLGCREQEFAALQHFFRFGQQAGILMKSQYVRFRLRFFPFSGERDPV